MRRPTLIRSFVHVCSRSHTHGNMLLRTCSHTRMTHALADAGTVMHTPACTQAHPLTHTHCRGKTFTCRYTWLNPLCLLFVTFTFVLFFFAVYTEYAMPCLWGITLSWRSKCIWVTFHVSGLCHSLPTAQSTETSTTKSAFLWNRFERFVCWLVA